MMDSNSIEFKYLLIYFLILWIFIIQDLKILSIIFKKNLIEISNIGFLKAIEQGFINITKHNWLKNSICTKFPNAKLNFDIILYESLIENYVFKKDRKFALISGGFFSSYNQNSLTKLYPKIFEILVENKDVDIYIESTNGKDYAKHYNLNLFKHKDYKMSSLKLKTEKYTINFIFPNNIKNLKNIDLINDFDLDFSKIFYSYKKKAIFVYQTLFDQFECLNYYYGLNISPKFLNIHYETLFKKKKEFKFFPKFLQNNPDALSNKFYRGNVLRFYKYLSKGFFEVGSEEKMKKILKFYNEPFLSYLKKNC